VIDAVVEHFRLGRRLAPAARVPGGLSNEMWRVVTESGSYAVKRMVASVDRPNFVANIEASFEIERRAYAGGVPMPRPVVEPVSGGALARIGTSLVRVHEWADSTPGDVSVLEVMGLLGRIHAVGGTRLDERRSGVWESQRWGQDITVLAELVTAGAPARLLAVDSHRDLDRKNVLRSEHSSQQSPVAIAAQHAEQLVPTTIRQRPRLQLRNLLPQRPPPSRPRRFHRTAVRHQRPPLRPPGTGLITGPRPYCPWKP
jgi:hypothetical protein